MVFYVHCQHSVRYARKHNKRKIIKSFINEKWRVCVSVSLSVCPQWLAKWQNPDPHGNSQAILQPTRLVIRGLVSGILQLEMGTGSHIQALFPFITYRLKKGTCHKKKHLLLANSYYGVCSSNTTHENDQTPVQTRAGCGKLEGDRSTEPINSKTATNFQLHYHSNG